MLMRKSGHFIMLLRREDTIIHTHTHTPFHKGVLLKLPSRPAPLWEGHTTTDPTTPLWRDPPGVDSPLLGQAMPPQAGHPTVDRPPLCGEAPLVWIAPRWDRPPPLDSRPPHPMWTAPPGVLSTHLCSCGTCPCVLAAEGPPGSG